MLKDMMTNEMFNEKYFKKSQLTGKKHISNMTQIL